MRSQANVAATDAATAKHNFVPLTGRFVIAFVAVPTASAIVNNFEKPGVVPAIMNVIEGAHLFENLTCDLEYIGTDEKSA